MKNKPLSDYVCSCELFDYYWEGDEKLLSHKNIMNCESNCSLLEDKIILDPICCPYYMTKDKVKVILERMKEVE